MLQEMDSPEQAGCSRVVRFDNECVLIPKSTLTRSKLPVVLTKSYSLPLWKRRSHQFSDSDVEDPAGSSAQPQSSEDNRVTIKVPIPTFVNLSNCILLLFKLPFSGLEEGLPVPQLISDPFLLQLYRNHYLRALFIVHLQSWPQAPPNLALSVAPRCQSTIAARTN